MVDAVLYLKNKVVYGTRSVFLLYGNIGVKENSSYQGFLFAYELSASCLSLKFMRFITLHRIWLEDVKTMHAAHTGEMLPNRLKSLHRILYNRIWPAFGYNTIEAPRYVIEMKNQTRVFLRMKSGFHYKVRTAIGRLTFLAKEHSRMDPLWDPLD